MKWENPKNPTKTQNTLTLSTTDITAVAPRFELGFAVFVVRALADRVVETTFPVVHRAMGSGQKSIKLVWRCHYLLSGFLSTGHLPRVSRQSRRSLMIMK